MSLFRSLKLRGSVLLNLQQPFLLKDFVLRRGGKAKTYFVYVEPRQRSMRAKDSEGSLANAGDLALVGQLAEADTADAVVTQISVGAAADLAAVVARVENLAGACCLRIIDFLAISHILLLSVQRERRPGSAARVLLHRSERWCRSRCPCRGSCRSYRTRSRGRSAAP